MFGHVGSMARVCSQEVAYRATMWISTNCLYLRSGRWCPCRSPIYNFSCTWPLWSVNWCNRLTNSLSCLRLLTNGDRQLARSTEIHVYLPKHFDGELHLMTTPSTSPLVDIIQGQFRKYIGVCIKIVDCSWWLIAYVVIILCWWVWSLPAKTSKGGWNNNGSQTIFSNSLFHFYIFFINTEHWKSHIYLAKSLCKNIVSLLFKWKWFHITMCHLSFGWRTDTLEV